MKRIHDWAYPDADDFMAAEMKSDGTYQASHLHAAMTYVTDRSCALDAGAHVGTWSRLMSGLFKRVVAVEPSEDTFEALNANMETFGCQNVETHRCALGATAGTVSIAPLDPRAEALKNTGARFVRDGGEIPRITIDSLELPSLGFLKLDIEGSEPLALEGARKTLKRCRPIVLFEHKGFCRRFGFPPDGAQQVLQRAGYRELEVALRSDLGGGMNLLMVGAGKGSWEIRGVQLGAALGARVTSTPTDADWRWADVAVLHKKLAPQFAPAAHAHQVPIVWDALDCWAQPGQNGLSPAEAKQLLDLQIKAIRPALVIGATEAQAAAVGGGVCLPHHSRPGLEPAPARAAVKTVAYEGNVAYLGQWHRWVSEACARRGWQFVVNPPDLREADILVAFRDGPWDGWICREWKSGVKLVNAMAAGRPIVTQMSAAWRELAPAGTVIDAEAGLSVAFDRWTDQADRDAAVDQPRARALTLDQVAARYRLILDEVRTRCAA